MAPINFNQGGRAKNIRIVEGDLNISTVIDGVLVMKLKSEFVRKILACQNTINLYFIAVSSLVSSGFYGSLS